MRWQPEGVELHLTADCPDVLWPSDPADVRYSALNVGGILLGLLGSIGYSAVSYVESKASRQASFKEREPPLSPPGPRAAASRVSSGRLARAESARSEGRGEAR